MILREDHRVFVVGRIARIAVERHLVALIDVSLERAYDLGEAIHPGRFPLVAQCRGQLATKAVTKYSMPHHEHG